MKCESFTWTTSGHHHKTKLPITMSHQKTSFLDMSSKIIGSWGSLEANNEWKIQSNEINYNKCVFGPLRKGDVNLSYWKSKSLSAKLSEFLRCSTASSRVMRSSFSPQTKPNSTQPLQTRHPRQGWQFVPARLGPIIKRPIKSWPGPAL